MQVMKAVAVLDVVNVLGILVVLEAVVRVVVRACRAAERSGQHPAEVDLVDLAGGDAVADRPDALLVRVPVHGRGPRLRVGSVPAPGVRVGAGGPGAGGGGRG